MHGYVVELRLELMRDDCGVSLGTPEVVNWVPHKPVMLALREGRAGGLSDPSGRPTTQPYDLQDQSFVSSR